MTNTEAAPALTVKRDGTALRLAGADGATVTVTGSAAEMRLLLMRALDVIDAADSTAALCADVARSQSYPCR